VEVFPLMSRDWQLRCSTTSDFDHAWRTLAALHVSNEKLFRLESNGQNQIFLETAITRGLEPNALIEGANGPPIPFRDVFSCIAVKSGHHYDKGSVWLSIPKSSWTPPAKMPVWNLYNIAIEALLGPEAPVQALLDQTHRVRA
jgi:hypothetical protein